MNASTMNEPDFPPYDDSAAPEFDKISGRWYFRVANPGEIFEVDALLIGVMSGVSWSRVKRSFLAT